MSWPVKTSQDVLAHTTHVLLLRYLSPETQEMLVERSLRARARRGEAHQAGPKGWHLTDTVLKAVDRGPPTL